MATRKADLLGDSFIRRLGEKIEDQKLGNVDVTVMWYGGSRTYHLSEYLPHIGDLRPDIVFLHVGGNDLDGPSTPEDVATRLSALVEKLLSRGVGRVLVGGITHRSKTRHVTVEEFKKKVIRMNQLLRRFSGHLVSLSELRPRHLQPDGVHLNSTGTTKYLHIVRRALNH